MTERPDLFVAISTLHAHLSEAAELLRNLRLFSLNSPHLRLYEVQLLEIRAVVCSEIAERIADRETTAAARYERKRKRLERRLKGDGA